jgi:hypothetical protein
MPSQLALAWLLKRSPVMLPIPGTSTVAHLEDNLAAAAPTSRTTSSPSWLPSRVMKLVPVHGGRQGGWAWL